MQVKRPSTGLPDWLYTAIVVVLGLYFVIGGITWSVLIYNGIQAPDSFATILATIAGGLVGVLSPVRVTTRPPQPAESAPTDER
jgi:uncharacterized membrane protein YqgA involved in biofilm formation